MSILKTTHTGSKAIPVSEQTINNEIKKLGYTYNSTLGCWFCRKNALPDIVIAHFYAGWDGSNIFNIYIYYTTCKPTTYCITTMYDLFNIIKELKTKCQS